MKNKLNIYDVANFFLNVVDRDSGSTITPLKLQKLLYYSQGYYLALYDKPLFDEEFEAWMHGPANVEIYQKYKNYTFDLIPQPNSNDIPYLDKELLDFLYKIWESFGIYDGKYLEELTHQETPWKIARNGYDCGAVCHEVISKESMKEFFKTIVEEYGF